MIARNGNMKIILLLLLFMGLLTFPFVTYTQASEKETTDEQVTTTWTDLEMDVPVDPGEYSNGVAYDSESDRIIFTKNLDTWAYDCNAKSWENMSASNANRAFAGGATAYDSESDRIIAFGGFAHITGHYYHTTETWAYDYNSNAWTNLTTGNAPSERGWFNMAYDSESDRIIIFGGVIIDDSANWIFNDETWAYDYNTNIWTNMNPAKNPGLRSSCGMTYDVESDRIILFGGRTKQIEFSDTWVYDYNANTWKKMIPSVNPSPRKGLYGAMTYDMKSDRVIFFGGNRPGGYPSTLPVEAFNDTWTYDYNINTWTELNFGISPIARRSHIMAYDEESDKMILMAGVADFGVNLVHYYDIWSLDYKPNLPDAPQSLQAVHNNGTIDLTWEAPISNGGSNIINYNVYRGTTSSEINKLVQLVDVLEYSDSDVEPGVTYYYAVSAINIVGEGSTSDQVSVTVTVDTTTPTTAISTPLDLVVSLVTLFMIANIVIFSRRRT